MSYKNIDIFEKDLEFYISKNSHLIENGLKYISHQQRTFRGPLDVLFVDSGNSLVIAELKASEEDDMLVQGLDYYDYINENLEFYTRNFSKNNDLEIDPTQKPRLFLIAPSFSIKLKKRASWIDIPIYLYTYKSIKIDERDELLIIFNEETIPSRNQPVEVYTIQQKIDYIKDEIVKERFQKSLDKIKTIDEKRIVLDPIKNNISVKVSGRLIAYYAPNRKNFWISTYDKDNEWKDFRVNSDEDLPLIEEILILNYEKYKK